MLSPKPKHRTSLGPDLQNILRYTHTRLTALCPGLPRWAGIRKGKPIWILLKQQTVSGGGISWAICKSAPLLQTDNHASTHHSVFYRPYALPAAQPTASKHWRHKISYENLTIMPKLRWTYDRRLIYKTSYKKTQGFSLNRKIFCKSGPW